MEAAGNGDVVKELHGDLARKYKTHAAAIEPMWRSFDRRKRAQCMTDGTRDGTVLKHPEDRSLGEVYKFIPEWNLRDVAEPGSDLLLELLRHRATTSLMEQYCTGLDGRLGDYNFICDMVQNKRLRHKEAFKDCFTLFIDEEKYGQSFQVMSRDALARFAPAIEAGCCIPQAIGELVLLRQIYILQSLLIVIDDILEQGSQTRRRREPAPDGPKLAVGAALSKLSIQDDAPPTPSLADLAAAARDQRDALEQQLELLSTEPEVLAHAVTTFFFSRPELVPDEKGRRLPATTDRHVSGSLFDAVREAVKAAAVWAYIGRLLDLLPGAEGDRAARAPLLQELSNACQLEYGRAQALFRRSVQTGTGAGWFRRASGGADRAGNARVALRGSPEELTRADPQLHYVLRLCQPDTDAGRAVDWVRKLSRLYAAHPLEREKLLEGESDALCGLVAIVAFAQDLASALPLPRASRKNGQAFVAGLQDLEAELNQLRPQLDVRDFAVPIDHLLEPGMAEGALAALDRFVVDRAGTKMGFLYQDLVDDALALLQARCRDASARAEQLSSKAAPPAPAPAASPPPREKLVAQRRDKEKTRPSHSSAYEIRRPEDPPAAAAAAAEEAAAAAAAPPQTFRVPPATARVFATLFARAGQSRGAVSWAAFEAAMAGLGFAVLPRYGSVYRFVPPDGMPGAARSFTLHRPHGAHLHGRLVLLVARHLRRAYGWGPDTFEAA